MFGGGRYAGLVGQFGVEPLEAVGFGMGDATLINFLEANDLVPQLEPEVDIYAIIVGDLQDRAQPVIASLRQAGLKIAVDLSGRKLDKQTKSASKRGLNYVLYIGQEELDSQKFTLKNLASGQESKLSLDQIKTQLV